MRVSVSASKKCHANVMREGKFHGVFFNQYFAIYSIWKLRRYNVQNTVRRDMKPDFVKFIANAFLS